MYRSRSQTPESPSQYTWGSSRANVYVRRTSTRRLTAKQREQNRRILKNENKVEERVRKALLRTFEKERKKIKTEMIKEFKQLLKPIPEGYFRSIHTRRILKDTPQNRYRETLPYETPAEKAEKRQSTAEARLTLIENETDDRVKHGMIRAAGVLTLQEWNILNRDGKIDRIKAAIAVTRSKQQKFNDAYNDSEVQKRTRDPNKVQKARTKLSYVDSPDVEEAAARTTTVSLFKGNPDKTSLPRTSRTQFFGDTDSDDASVSVADADYERSEDEASDCSEAEEDYDDYSSECSNELNDSGPKHYESDWDKIISRSSIPLRDYQIRAVKHLKDNHGVVAAFDVGSGKTLTAVAASVCLLESGIVDRVIVVAPKSLFHNFNKELKAFIGNDEFGKPVEFGFMDCYENFTHTMFINTFKQQPEGCDNTLLIIDEAAEYRTAIKEDGSGKSAFAMINCCIRAKRVLCLTATPLVNDLSDITNLVAMAKGEVPLAMPLTLAGKIDYLRNIFAFHTLDTSKDDLDRDVRRTEASAERFASSDLPEKRYHSHEFEMTEDYYKQYLAIQRSQTDTVNANGKKPDPFAFLTGLRHATNSIQPNPKIEWALDRVADLGLKTVLYSAFIDDGIRLLEDGLDSRGVKYVVISGELDSIVRAEAVRQYNDPKSGVNVMLISKAGSLGLDLKETREVIFIEGSWNPAQEEQVEGRACRIGSHSRLPPEERFVDIHRLILIKPPMDKLAPGDMVPSADSLLRGILEGKRKNLERDYFMLKSVDIDPVKAEKFKLLYQERFMNDTKANDSGAQKFNNDYTEFNKRYEEFMKKHKEFMDELNRKRRKNEPPSFEDTREKERREKEYAKFFENKKKFEEERKRRQDNAAAKVFTTTKCPYEILGLPKGSTMEECRRAFKMLAVKLHPDRNYHATHEERMQNEAHYKRAASALDYITGKDSRPMF